MMIRKKDFYSILPTNAVIDGEIFSVKNVFGQSCCDVQVSLRRVAAEQMNSPDEFFVSFYAQKALIPELQNWDPEVLDSMIFIGNSQ
jgi:hypothetical protein